MGTRVNYSGLVIAGIGFFLTRFTVTLAFYQDPVRFYLAGVVPLVLGLGLAAFGVALTVVDLDESLVRTTVVWCVVGTATMLILVVLTLLGSTSGGLPDVAAMRSRTYLSNFLIGGSVGGTLTGLYAAHNRRQRVELRNQANRLEVLNRLLRHEVLNAVTAVRGYVEFDAEEAPRSRDVIDERSRAIQQTIEEVKYLTRSTRSDERAPAPVALDEHLARSVETVREAHPAAEVDVRTHPEDPTVFANERLATAFANLIENAVVHSEDGEPTVEVSVSTTPGTVRVSVSDDGPGLPADQRALLETGEIGEFDDPTSGFGLNIVRLLVESYGGDVETDVDADGSTVTVVLNRADAGVTGLRTTGAGLTGVRPAVRQLVVTLGAAIVAGVLYGVAAEQLGGSVAFIGVYYGVEDAVVGWITHEFHSVVFAFAFAGILSLAPARYRTRPLGHLALGTAWGITLWIVAAGIVSPIWLRLVGFPTPLPNLSPDLFVTHVVWGASLGALTAIGYGTVTPWLTRLGARFGRGPDDA